MLEEGDPVMYYLTVTNEFYKMPAMPENVEEGILKGMYKFRPSANSRAKVKAHLMGSGAILNEALEAQKILEEEYDVPADVWSVTSYKNLYWDGIETERDHIRHPGEDRRPCFVAQQFAEEKGVYVAASDYLKALPASIAKWVPGPMVVLGTDGFGRSDTRKALRDFFEVDARHIAFAALSEMARQKRVKASVVKKAVKKLEIDPEKINPLIG